MSELYNELIKLGEYYVAGYIEYPDRDRIYKYANALKTNYKYIKMPETNNENILYPSGDVYLYNNGQSLFYFYCFGLFPIDDNYSKIYNALPENLKDEYKAAYDDILYYVGGDAIDNFYGVGGLSYVHSIINFERILKEGLDGYLDRIKSHENNEFYDAMALMVEGIKLFWTRTIEYLEAMPNPNKKLISALKNVPFKPAANFYEAMVCINFMYYIDGADDIGRFDQYINRFLTEDISDEVAIETMKALWNNVNARGGWQVTIGGCDENGNNASNRATKLVLKSSKGIRRPNLTFRLREDETDEIWDLIFEDWASGNGHPAIYNDDLYVKGVGNHYNAPMKDLARLAYGGCTETMFDGISNVGSIESGISTLKILEDAIYRYLDTSNTYEEFYSKFIDLTKMHIGRAIRQSNFDQEHKAKYQPLPIRTLLIDDCIDTGVEYQAGGARYNGACFNFAGVTNVINSLYSLKELGFRKKYSNKEIIEALKDNFNTHSDYLNDIKKLPRFGNAVSEVDEIGKDFYEKTTSFVYKHKTWRGNGPYVPSHIIFVTYDMLGELIGATPDGRFAKKPIADSIGANQGEDKQGPTSLLNSLLTIPIKEFVGTPVTNLRISKASVINKDLKEKTKALIKTYFKEGGMQLQVSVVDQKAMLDAIKHPENYENLIVRIGGYSEYFNALSEPLKLEVIKRTCHSLN